MTFLGPLVEQLTELERQRDEARSIAAQIRADLISMYEYEYPEGSEKPPDMTFPWESTDG